jgi:serine/threonine protein kinase
MGDSEIDQIHKIFQTFGTPCEETWPGVSKLSEFRGNYPKWTGHKLRHRVPLMDTQAYDLLQSMLEVNPNKRITAKDALNHPYFR